MKTEIKYFLVFYSGTSTGHDFHQGSTTIKVEGEYLNWKKTEIFLKKLLLESNDVVIKGIYVSNIIELTEAQFECWNRQ